MKRLIPVMTIALLITASCKKKAADTPASYMPNTANSSWNYDTKTTSPALATGNYTLKATNKDTVIGSRTYRVYTNSGSANEYYAQVGSDYYQYTSGAGGISTQPVEVLYLKDAAAGTTWTENQTITMNSIPISTVLTYQIAEKGISYTTNGKTYTDVTHVKVTLGALTLPLPIPITQTSDINFYYARGVGRIYTRTKVSVAAPLLTINLSIDNELLLKTYTIQ